MWKLLRFTLIELTLRADWLSWVGVSSSSSRTAKKSLLAKVSNCIGLSSLFSKRWPSLSCYTRARKLTETTSINKGQKGLLLELVRQLDVALGCWNWAGRLAACLSHQYGCRARRNVLLVTKGGRTATFIATQPVAACFCEAAAIALAFRHPRPLLDMAASKFTIHVGLKNM